MKKTELFALLHKKNIIDDFIWFTWSEWKERENHKICKLPKFFNWFPDLKTGVIHFYWEGGTEDVPIIEFYSDEEDQPNLEMLWHQDYYDRPLSGVAKYNGNCVWFQIANDSDILEKNDCDTFNLHELSNECLENLINMHECFCKYVGNHTNHHPDLYKKFTNSNSKRMNKFYKTKFPKIDPKKGKIIGQFPWFQFKYWFRPVEMFE